MCDDSKQVEDENVLDMRPAPVLPSFHCENIVDNYETCPSVLLISL